MTDDLNLPLPPDVVDAIRDAIEARYPNQPVLTPDEVAELLRISDDTVVRRFRKVKVATKWRIPVATLLADLANPRLCDERGSASVRAVATLALVPLLLALLGVMFGFAPNASAAKADGGQVLIFGAEQRCTDGTPPYKAEYGTEVLATVSVGKTYPMVSTEQMPSYGTVFWIRVDGVKCMVTGQQGALLDGALDTATFKSMMLSPDAETGDLLAGLLAGGAAGPGLDIIEALGASQPTIRSVPSREGADLGSVDPGEMIPAANWFITAQGTLVGTDKWVPVKAPGGGLGFVLYDALLTVPDYNESDFTTTIRPEQDVTAYMGPSHDAGVAAEVPFGSTINCITTAWMGWLACNVGDDAQVKRGWVFQPDLSGDPGAATPEGEDSDWPKVAGVLSTTVDGYFEANGQKSETANAGVEMQCYEPVGEWVSCDWSSPTYEMGTGTDRTAFFRIAELEAAGLEIPRVAAEEPDEEPADWVVVGEAENGDLIVDCEPLSAIEKGKVGLSGTHRCASTQELIELTRETVGDVLNKPARVFDKGRLQFAGILGSLAIVASLGATALSRLHAKQSLLAKSANALAPGMGLMPHLLLPGAVVLAFFAGKAAPTRNFLVYSVTGAVLVASVIGLAVAVKMLAAIKAPSFTSASGQYAAVAALVTVPATHWVGGLSWPLAVVIAGPLAGLVAGLTPGLMANSPAADGPAAQPPGDDDPFFVEQQPAHDVSAHVVSGERPDERVSAQPLIEPPVSAQQSASGSAVNPDDDFWAGA